MDFKETFGNAPTIANDAPADVTTLPEEHHLENPIKTPWKIEKETIPVTKSNALLAWREKNGGASPIHPDTVTIAGMTYDLRKKPKYQRAYYERLANVGNSLSNAIKLHCLQCSAYDQQEAKRCNLRDCALWVVRYNRSKRNEKTDSPSD